jgi:ABC-type Na+ efflux pump permease subunit
MIEPLETATQLDRRIKDAQRAYDQRAKAEEVHGDHIKAYSLAAMRAPALVAAGGVVAVLGFYSANFDRLSTDPAKLDILNQILFWLFLSLMLTVVAPAFAYFGQLAYQDALRNETHHYEWPYFRPTRRYRIALRVGVVCRWITVAIMTLAITALAVGGIMFLHLVQRDSMHHVSSFTTTSSGAAASVPEE